MGMGGLTLVIFLWQQAAKYDRKIAELEDIIYDSTKQQAELAAEKERLERALPTYELLTSDLKNKVRSFRTF